MNFLGNSVTAEFPTPIIYIRFICYFRALVCRYKTSALATELNSSIAVAGKELSLSSWCIASLYMYHRHCKSSV